MSVALLVSNSSDTIPLRSVPVATEDMFTNHWLPASIALGLQYVPLFQTGMPVAHEDVNTIVSELDQLKVYFTANIQQGSDAQIRAFIIARIDLLKSELIKEVEESDHCLYIG